METFQKASVAIWDMCVEFMDKNIAPHSQFAHRIKKER
jgi:hypothetical protein